MLSSTKEVKINLSTSQYIKNGGLGLLNENNILVMPLEDLPAENVKPIKCIGAYCYAHNNRLTAIELTGQSLLEIDAFAFCEAENLTSVTFGNNIEKIGFEAFAFCDLRSLDLPSSLTYIDQVAFYGNKNLPSVDIPASVSAIDNAAFGKCAELRHVYMTGDYTVAPDIAENAFNEVPYYRIHVKDKATYDLFRAKPELSSFTIIYG